MFRRVMRVFDSNDPMARTLALRLLGEAAVLFAHSLKAQHTVLKRYGSTDTLKLMAAVDTSERFVKVVPAFLLVVWETVVSKAMDKSIPTAVRSHMVYSLRHAVVAAPQLCLILSGYCFEWLRTEWESTEIMSATLITWSATISKANPLELEHIRLVLDIVERSSVTVLRERAIRVLNRWDPDLSAFSPSDVQSVRDSLCNVLETELSKSRLSIPLLSLYYVLSTLRRLCAIPADISVVWNFTLRIYRHFLDNDYEEPDPGSAESSLARTFSDMDIDDDSKILSSDSLTSLPFMPPASRHTISTTLMVMKIVQLIGLKHAAPEVIERSVKVICNSWKILIHSISSGVDLSLIITKISLSQFMYECWRFCRKVDELNKLNLICLDALGVFQLDLCNGILNVLTNSALIRDDDLYKTIVGRLLETVQSTATGAQSTSCQRWLATTALLKILNRRDDKTIPIQHIVRETLSTIWDSNGCLREANPDNIPPAPIVLQAMLLTLSLGLWSEVQFVTNSLKQLVSSKSYLACRFNLP